MLDLLQISQPINGMNDVVFGVKDLVTIGGGVVATVTAYLTLKFELKAHIETYGNQIKSLKEDLMNAKNGRRAIEKNSIELLKEKDATIQKRIDKTQDKLEKEIEKNAEEFKQINSSISGIKVDTMEIKGMMQTLLAKKS